MISNIEYKAQSSQRQREMIKAYREKIENELKDICRDILVRSFIQ
jgi:14-3-3 protein beta/theta/zeta